MPQDPIYILDLMHGDSKPPQGVKALNLKKELDANGLDSTVFPSGTRAELFAALKEIKEKLAQKGMPFIHFFGHGEKQGIELYNVCLPLPREIRGHRGQMAGSLGRAQ